MEQQDFCFKSLSLTNFRKFEQLSVSLAPELTVFVADNGAGKTSLLEALRLALFPVVDAFGEGPSVGIQEEDVLRFKDWKAAAEQSEIGVTASVGGTAYFWTRTRKNKKSSRTRDGREIAAVLKYVAEKRAAHVEFVKGGTNQPPTFPLIAYYGTGRLWGTSKMTEGRKRHAKDMALPESAYADCLSMSANYELFKVWFKAAVEEARSEKDTGIPSPYHPHELLDAVQAAVHEALSETVGARMLYWDFYERKMLVIYEDGRRMPVDLLSDGVRSVLAMVADLAHRAARLNPHFGADACQKTPGIVMVDEIDLHLHPSWQQTIIDSLRRTFPKIQFILTTHSPQVLSTVDRDCIRILKDDGTVEMASEQTRGISSASILANEMAVSPIPDIDETRWLNEYMALIQDGMGDTAEALDLRERLIRHFGERHPEIERCDRFRQFIEIRNSNNSNKTSVSE